LDILLFNKQLRIQKNRFNHSFYCFAIRLTTVDFNFQQTTNILHLEIKPRISKTILAILQSPNIGISSEPIWKQSLKDGFSLILLMNGYYQEKDHSHSSIIKNDWIY
jgi:hypothetical protein